MPAVTCIPEEASTCLNSTILIRFGVLKRFIIEFIIANKTEFKLMMIGMEEEEKFFYYIYKSLEKYFTQLFF
jgi:hypothetical protein